LKLYIQSLEDIELESKFYSSFRLIAICDVLVEKWKAKVGVKTLRNKEAMRIARSPNPEDAFKNFTEKAPRFASPTLTS
jgi:LEA14-like dessication related protein